MLQKVNLAQKLRLFQETWSPKIVGRVNNFEVKLVKLQGTFDWHHHEQEDELFLVVKGSFVMMLRDGDVQINKGEFIIVPHGVEHCPRADEECHILLFEPAGVLNTGNIVSEKTASHLDEI